MPKLKTRKSVSSRVKVTKNKKVKRRRAGQSHFNSRDNGKAGRRKRKDINMAKGESNAYKQFLPYN